MAIRTSAWFCAAPIRKLVGRCGRGARRFAASMVIVGLSATPSAAEVPPVPWLGITATTPTSGPAVGVVGDITWGTSPADIDRTVASMAAAGVRWMRANMSWSGGEPDAKGVLNLGWLAQVDYAVTRARAMGIEVLMPIADGVPYWASADPAKYSDASGNHWNKYWRPTNAADYAAFVRAMVSRYQALGVHAYEVWNEPNTSLFWPSGPSAAEYTTLLAAAYPAIKAADPTATVVLGGLSKNDYDFLAQLYAAGARSYFDVVAVHPYTGSVDPTWCWNQGGTTKLAKDAFCGIEEVHNTMVANGDSAKPIWLTEFGWSTTTGPYGVSEATQAQFLTKALDRIRSLYPYVQTAFWYNFRNNFWLADAPADYEANLGLLRVDFTAKPAYTALGSWAGGATSDTAPPSAPANLIAIGGPKKVTLLWSASTDAGGSGLAGYEVFRATSANGTFALVGTTTAATYTDGGLNRGKQYWYRIQAKDSAGNRSTVSNTASAKAR